MYLLHCKKIDIYANISLFLSYSEVTVATRYGPYQTQMITAVNKSSPYPDQMITAVTRSRPYPDQMITAVTRSSSYPDQMITAVNRSSPYPDQMITAVTRSSPYPDQMVNQYLQTTSKVLNVSGDQETYGAFPLHGTARYGSLLGGFPLGTVPGTWYFFSTTSAEVPSEPYRYQNVTCKLY